MAKPYDAALKQLVAVAPLDWVRLLGFEGQSAVLLTTELTANTIEADALLKISDPDQVLHLEFQTGYEALMSQRTWRYNTRTHDRMQLPVYSAVILLREEADGPGMNGRYEYGRMVFEYDIVRVWQIPSEVFLSGSAGLLPLALIADTSGTNAETIIEQIEARAEAELGVSEQEQLWASAYLLMDCVTMWRRRKHC